MGKLDLIDVIEDDDSKDFELSDEMAIQQEESLERGRKEIFDIQQKKIQKLDEEIKDLQQDREQRKEFADKIFDFMRCYLFSVFFIIMLNVVTINNFKVSDEVILALLGTTAIEVIGTFAIVARYLFSKKQS
jgi:uncharacterized membrane protein YcjF (UPF0283 family)